MEQTSDRVTDTVTLGRCLNCGVVDIEENFNMCLRCLATTCNARKCADVCPCTTVRSQN